MNAPFCKVYSLLVQLLLAAYIHQMKDIYMCIFLLKKLNMQEKEVVHITCI
jgi:hypothetical protein